MPTYITLIHYTKQGVKTFKELSQRIEETKAAGEAVGAEIGRLLPDDGTVRRHRDQRSAGRPDDRQTRARRRRPRQCPDRDDAGVHRRGSQEIAGELSES